MPENIPDLIARAKRGDKNAFGDIYSLHLTRIYRFVYYLVYDEALAEDITQEAFVRAWKFLPKFSIKKGTILAFLYTIARNLVIDEQRKKKEIKLESQIVHNIESNENLEANYLDGERQSKVHAALTKLDKNEKQLIILRYFEELSFSEIAEIFKEREGNLRVKVHRTLKKLKDFLKNKFELEQ